MKSNIILFLLGILLCTVAPAKEEVIQLHKANHVTFTGPVNARSVAQAQIKLGQLSRSLPDSATIYLILDTPGGSISAGNLFIDYANSLPQTIKPICLFCASMGYHFFQSFGERIVFPSSTLMSHRAYLGGLEGQVPGEFEVRLNSLKVILDQMDAKVAKRVGLSVPAYRALIHDEFWVNGVSAVQSRHADKVARITCSKALLEGTKLEPVMTLFGPIDVEVSACPLISGPVSVKLKKESKFRSEVEAINHVRNVNRTVIWSL